MVYNKNTTSSFVLQHITLKSVFCKLSQCSIPLLIPVNKGAITNNIVHNGKNNKNRKLLMKKSKDFS